VIINIAALFALRLLIRLGAAPRGVIVRKSLSALSRDDLTSAVDFYFDAAKRDFSSEKVQVLREILVSEIRFRQKVLADRMRDLAAEKHGDPQTSAAELDACGKAEKLLEDYLTRLGARPV